MRPALADRHICAEPRTKEKAGPYRPGRKRVRFMVDRSLLIAETSRFIESYNVTHYFTLTYPAPRSWEGRHKAFAAWIDGIEWLQRRPLGWFRADEMYRYSGLGSPAIPEHHHGLLVDTDHLSFALRKASGASLAMPKCSDTRRMAEPLSTA